MSSVNETPEGYVTFSAAYAEDEKCPTPVTAGRKCGIAAPGNEYVGELDIPLEYCGTVEHPYWDSLDNKWYSFAFVSSQRKVEREIRRVSSRSDHMAREEVELPVGQRTTKHCYELGRVLILAVSCIEEGWFIFLVTKPLTAEDNGTTFEFYDYEQYRKYAFPAPKSQYLH